MGTDGWADVTADEAGVVGYTANYDGERGVDVGLFNTAGECHSLPRYSEGGHRELARAVGRIEHAVYRLLRWISRRNLGRRFRGDRSPSPISGSCARVLVG